MCQCELKHALQPIGLVNFKKFPDIHFEIKFPFVTTSYFHKNMVRLHEGFSENINMDLC